MPFLLDTTICSWSLRLQPGAKVHSLMMQHLGQLYVSRLTCAELYALGYRSNAKQLQRIDDLIETFRILDFDDACAREYGRLHARLAERGQNAGRTDLMIAATAMVHGLVLVTYDSDFETCRNVISELRIHTWDKP